MIVELPPTFGSYVDAAIVRLSAQIPEFSFASVSGGISVEPSPESLPSYLRAAIMHAVYRERIYSETLAMREALLSAVMR